MALQAINKCTAMLKGRYDKARGGFGGAPKFPRPSEINVLLHSHLLQGNAAQSSTGVLSALMLLGCTVQASLAEQSDCLGCSHTPACHNEYLACVNNGRKCSEPSERCSSLASTVCVWTQDVCRTLNVSVPACSSAKYVRSAPFLPIHGYDASEWQVPSQLCKCPWTDSWKGCDIACSAHGALPIRRGKLHAEAGFPSDKALLDLTLPHNFRRENSRMG